MSPVPKYKFSGFFLLDGKERVLYVDPVLGELSDSKDSGSFLADIRKHFNLSSEPEFQAARDPLWLNGFFDDTVYRSGLQIIPVRGNRRLCFLDFFAENSVEGEWPATSLLLLGLDGEITYISPEAERVLGIGQGKNFQNTPTNIDELLHPMSAFNTKADLRKIKKASPSQPQKIRIRFKHPRYAWVTMEGVITNLEEKAKGVGLLLCLREVEEEQEMKRLIHEYQYKFEGILEHNDAMVFMKDLEGYYIEVNSAFVNFFGRDRESYVGTQDTYFFPPEEAKAIMDLDAEVMRTGVPQKFEERLTIGDGTKRDFATSKFAVRDVNGNIVGICGITYDVTHERQYLRDLEQSSAFFKAVVENAYGFVTILDAEGEKRSVTPNVQAIIGFEAEDYLRFSIFDDIHPSDEAKFLEAWQNILNGRTTAVSTVSLRIKNSRGQWIWAQYILNNLLQNEHVQGIVVNVSNNQDLKTMQLQAEQDKLLFSDFMRNLPSAVAAFSLEDRLLVSNKEFATRIAPKRHLLEKINSYWVDNFDDTEQISFTFSDQQNPVSETYETVKFPLRDPENKIYGFGVICTDITQRAKSEEKMYGLAFIDSLTNLPNYNLLLKEITQRIKKNLPFALTRVDVYDYRNTSDSLGPKTGEKLTLALAKVVTECVESGDFVARATGQGLFVLTSGTEVARVKDLVGQIFEAAKRIIPIPGLQFHLKINAGIVFSNAYYRDPAQYLQDANIAIQQAEEKGSYRLQFFDNQVRAYLKTKLLMDSSLSQAFERNEFELYYQPIHALNAPGEVSCEALIRWNHTTKGILAPGSFFEYIEDPRLRTRLDDWVIERAFQQTKRLVDKFPNISVSINVHPTYFGYRRFLEYIQRNLQAANLHPRHIKLEITENMLLEDTEAVTDVIRSLREMGIGIMLDDFGTGYSSLSYLAQLPVDWIKIDKTFVDTLCEDAKQRQLVSMIIDIAEKIQARTIAEGVEEGKQIEALRDLRCEAVQGYYYARPMPFHELLVYLEQHSG